jgi:hypothetical protein
MAASVQLQKKISGRDLQGAWHKDELMGGNRQSQTNSDFDYWCLQALFKK